MKLIKVNEDERHKLVLGLGILINMAKVNDDEESLKIYRNLLRKVK